MRTLWTSSSPPTMTGRSINALSNTWPNFFHLKFQVKMVEFASAWDVWIPSEALKQGPNTSKSAKDMSQSRSSSLMMKTWNKKTWTTRCQFYLSVMLISNFPERGLKLEKTNQKRVLQMNMRNTGLQDIASSLQARERKRSLIWSQSWDTKGLKIKSCKIIRHSSWERCKKYLPYPSGLSRQVKIPRISRTPKHVTCEKEFLDEDDENPIIRDHCHFSGRFKGAAIWNSRSQRRFLLSFTTSPKNQIERES